MAVNQLSDFFDTSVREQLEATFSSISSDKVFLFAGPPKFINASEAGRSLCPLLFSTGINIGEGRALGGQAGSLGSNTFIDLPSSRGNHQITVSSYAVVTGKPTKTIEAGEVQTTNTSTFQEEERWNLLKRVYYDAINFEGSGGKLIDFFLPESDQSTAKTSLGFTPVGLDAKDLFTNFGKSEFYEVPFGILAILMTKSHSIVTTRYFEGCKLQSPGQLLSANVGQMATMQPVLQMSFKDELPVRLNQNLLTLAGSDTEYGSFMKTLSEYIGDVQ